MSKRQSRSAIFKGKFLNTLKNLEDTPAAKRDEGWARRAVGFANARIAEANVLAEQADAFLKVGDGSDEDLPLGTEETPVTRGHSTLHTGYKLLKIADAHLLQALTTLTTVRNAGLHSPTALYNRGRSLSTRIQQKVKRIHPRLSMLNATRRSRGTKPSKRGQQPKKRANKQRRKKGK